jgi:hypothetical protein
MDILMLSRTITVSLLLMVLCLLVGEYDPLGPLALVALSGLVFCKMIEK